MADERLLKLAAGDLELVLAPLLGGSIARFDHVRNGVRTPVLRGAEGVPDFILDAGSFPLVPFVNRVRGGRFHFRGREVVLSPNMRGEKSPLHGQGWRSPWQVEHAGETEAELGFRHEPGEWPWAYRARQIFSLDAEGLTLRLACRNEADEPMPCGLGFHPYFPCTNETRIDTRVAHVWTIDEDVLPVAKVPAEGRYDLKDRQACAQDLDHGFGGWGGQARIYSPDLPFEIVLSSSEARFFQLYSPPEGGLFVAEPVTHANAAMNEPEEKWPHLGLQVLEPGEEMSLEMRLALTLT